MFQSVGRVISGKTKPGLARSVEAAVVVAKATAASRGLWQATRFRSGRLTIIAPTPIEAQELSLQRRKIKDDLNLKFDQELIKEVIVRTQ